MGNGYVESLLDNDQYKYTMQNAVCKLFPRDIVRYTFINRDGREFPDNFGEELRRIIDTFRGLILSRDEKEFLRANWYYVSPVYIDFLTGYRYDPEEVRIRQEGSKLIVEVVGLWYRTILWEVPLMSVISQLYFEMTTPTKLTRKEREENNKIKAERLRTMEVLFADFASRRRYSHLNHDEVISDMKKYGKENFIGTSNPYFAMKYGLKSIGTQAHEWYQFHGAKYGFRMANEMGLKNWVDVYQGQLGIALPDTYTTDAFLSSFDGLYARTFDGMRHDSGCPVEFVKKAVNHYDFLRIDPTTKTLIFSDSINKFKKIADIKQACSNFIRHSYGIGTWFGNDVGVKPLNIVVKMTGVKLKSSALGFMNDEWISTVKLSDDKGKNTGDSEMVDLCKRVLMINES